jgi:hypothetical protein
MRRGEGGRKAGSGGCSLLYTPGPRCRGRARGCWFESKFCCCLSFVLLRTAPRTTKIEPTGSSEQPSRESSEIGLFVRHHVACREKRDQNR